MNTKAQIWGLDLMAGMTLFMIGIMIFFIYSVNQPSQSEENLDLLFYEGQAISDALLSQGRPTNWNPSNVIVLGLTTSGQINQTKLESLYEMIYTNDDYQKTKNILATSYDYYLTFEENMTINSVEVQGIGKPGTTLENIEAANLVKITRLTTYQNKITPLNIYLWE